MPPQNRPVLALAKENGISEPTLLLGDEIYSLRECRCREMERMPLCGLKWTHQSRHSAGWFKLCPFLLQQLSGAAPCHRFSPASGPCPRTCQRSAHLPQHQHGRPDPASRSTAPDADARRFRTRSTAPGRLSARPCWRSPSGTHPRTSRCAKGVQRRCCPVLGRVRPC